MATITPSSLPAAPSEPCEALVADYDGRAGIEAELKSEKRGIVLATLRKRRLVAQSVVVLLVGLAHNVLSLCTQLVG